MTNANSGTFSSFTYTLDAVGNRTQMVATGAGAGTTSYSYDSLDRLTSVTYAGPTTDAYTYDAIGNRTAKNTTSYTYDDANEMTAAGGVTYTYDANGNQTGSGSDTFTHDHENRLTQAVVGGVTSSSVYYGNGLRLSHTVNGTTTTYTWDAASQLPVVIQDGTYSYVYGLDLILDDGRLRDPALPLVRRTGVGVRPHRRDGSGDGHVRVRRVRGGDGAHGDDGDGVEVHGGAGR